MANCIYKYKGKDYTKEEFYSLVSNSNFIQQEQTHILGSKQDIEGFKKFVEQPINKEIKPKIDNSKKIEGISLNIAGNGIYTMKGKYTQQQVDNFTYELLKAVVNSPRLNNKIESIRTGGQTGFDEAGTKAALKLGIPTLVLAPKNWKFRGIDGNDITNEQQFKARFTYLISTQLDLFEQPKEQYRADTPFTYNVYDTIKQKELQAKIDRIEAQIKLNLEEGKTSDALNETLAITREQLEVVNNTPITSSKKSDVDRLRDSDMTFAEIMESAKIMSSMALQVETKNTKNLVDVKEDIFYKLSKTLNTTTDETHKANLQKVLNNFETIYNYSKRLKNKLLNRAIEDDNSDNLFEQYVENKQKFNEARHKEESVLSKISQQLKALISSLPELNSTNYTVDEEGNYTLDYRKSEFTGLTIPIDFNLIFPYLSRNLIGARTRAEVLHRLDKMAQFYPSFFSIKQALEQNDNLLAQVESNIAKKYPYDSIVHFIKIQNGKLIVNTTNEIRNKNIEKLYNTFDSAINSFIDEISVLNLTTEEQNTIPNVTNKLITAKQKQDRLLNIGKKINSLGANFIDNKEEIADLIFDYLSEVGVNMSFAAINDYIESAKTFKEAQNSIIDNLELIKKAIDANSKSDLKKVLTNLANKQSKFQLDFVENSALSIAGQSIYSIRQATSISRFFDLVKTTTPEGKEELERFLIGLSTSPDFEYDTWLWNDENQEGFINYTLVDKKKVFKSVNTPFLSKFNFHNFGGSKDMLTKKVKEYQDYGDTDWKLIQVLNYLNLTNKTEGNKNVSEVPKGFVNMVALTPSDKSNIITYQVPKVKLKASQIAYKLEKNRLTSFKLDNHSHLFKSILKIGLNNIRKVQLATQELFVLDGDKLTVREDLNFSELQKNYHYDKITYNEDGTVNVEKTLLKNGKPTGNVFSLSMMDFIENGKVVSLNNTNILKNGVIPNVSITEYATEVIQHTEKFISNQIRTEFDALKEFREVLPDVFEGIGEEKGTQGFVSFVTEFALNQIISNHEQMQWFIGDTSEFASIIEVGKRAFLNQAPGLSTSSDSMKIQRPNKSWMDGKTYTYAAIADFKLMAHNIDFIIDTIKTMLLTNKRFENTAIDIEKIKNNNPTTDLEKAIHKHIKSYLGIKGSDGQGYMTLNRYEAVLRGLGRFDNKMEKFFNTLNRGEKLDSDDLYEFLNPETYQDTSLSALKPFISGRHYNSAQRRMSTTMIKLSLLPLIPQLTYGTDLDTIRQAMETKGIDELYYESAYKVGVKQIYKINNEDGSLNVDFLNLIEAKNLLNSDWNLQLDSPEHFIDEEIISPTQMNKKVTENISDEGKYTLNGKEVTGKYLKDRLQELWAKNINEDFDKVRKEFGIDENNQITDLTKISQMLQAQNLSDNSKYVVRTDKGKQTFNLPLSLIGSEKFESLLLSPFINKVIKQKFSGGSLVLASNYFLEKKTQSEIDNNGIEWSKDKTDRVLKSYDANGDGSTKVVEVLMGAWSKHFFKKGQRMSIDEIPDEIKTMIGIRIPTSSKHSMIVFKVVGFLPQQSRALIVTPNDLVAQMGSDFDIDKLYFLRKAFNSKLQVHKITDETKTTKLQRQNEMFDIYKTILTDSKHLGETIIPAETRNMDESIAVFKKLVNKNLDRLNPILPSTQRIVRNRNKAGKDLVAISARLNAYLPIAQNTRMYLDNTISVKYDLRVYSQQELMDKYGEDFTLIDNNFGIVNHRLVGFNRKDFTNVDGDYISENSAEKVVGSVDNAKEPKMGDLNYDIFSLPIAQLAESTGINNLWFSALLQQPAIRRIIYYRIANEGIVGKDDDAFINTIKRYYQSQIALETYAKNPKTANKTIKKFAERYKDKKHNIADLKRNELFYTPPANIEATFSFDEQKPEVFSEKELLDMISVDYNTLDSDAKIKYATNQLHMIKWFERAMANSDGFQKLINVTKLDTKEIKSLSSIRILLDEVQKMQRTRPRVFIDDNSAIDELLMPTSNYPVIKTMLEKYEQIYDILSPLFITQSASFVNVLNDIEKGNSIKLDEKQISIINRYLQGKILSDFAPFKTLDMPSVLGVENYTPNIKARFSFEEFRNLTTAEKIFHLQNRNSEVLKLDTHNILNALEIQFSKTELQDNKYHKIIPIPYKDINIDDELAYSFTKYIEEGDEFEKDAMFDLIKYSYLTNGLTFSLNSFIKMIPTPVLENIGLADFFVRQESLAKDGLLFDSTTSDKILNNQWTNPFFVPRTATQWEYEIGTDGKKHIKKDFIEGSEFPIFVTKEGTPNWNNPTGIIRVGNKSLKNVPKKIKNAEYIIVTEYTNNKEEKLYKKYTAFVQYEKEKELFSTHKKSFGSTNKKEEQITYYYQVDKQGTIDLNEMSNETVFSGNKSPHNESLLIAEIEGEIRGLEKQQITDSLVLDQISDEKAKEIAETCTLIRA